MGILPVHKQELAWGQTTTMEQSSWCLLLNTVFKACSYKDTFKKKGGKSGRFFFFAFIIRNIDES